MEGYWKFKGKFEAKLELSEGFWVSNQNKTSVGWWRGESMGISWNHTLNKRVFREIDPQIIRLLFDGRIIGLKYFYYGQSSSNCM